MAARASHSLITHGIHGLPFTCVQELECQEHCQEVWEAGGCEISRCTARKRERQLDLEDGVEEAAREGMELPVASCFWGAQRLSRCGLVFNNCMISPVFLTGSPLHTHSKAQVPMTVQATAMP